MKLWLARLTELASSGFEDLPYLKKQQRETEEDTYVDL